MMRFLLQPTGLVLIFSIVSLVVSHLKEQQTSYASTGRRPQIALIMQIIVVIAAAWASYDADSTLKRYRAADLDAKAAVAASAHSSQIMDVYMMNLLPHARDVQRYEEFIVAMDQVSPAIRDLATWRETLVRFQQQNQVNFDSFHKLQEIARAVLNETIQYGARYPVLLTQWASFTLERKDQELGNLISDTPMGEKYRQLTFAALGASITQYHEAAAKLAE